MPIDELLAILRDESDAETAWRRTRLLLQGSSPSGLWDALPSMRIEQDAAAAVAWLEAVLALASAPIGVYLGLDTLNMRGGDGHNIEIGWTSQLDAERNDTDWIYKGLEYGPRHLIGGLVELRSTYSRSEWAKLFSTADYTLFLSYSGIVLRQAIIKSARLPRPLLAAWGFHDGDIFLLGRLTANGFTSLAA